MQMSIYCRRPPSVVVLCLCTAGIRPVSGSPWKGAMWQYYIIFMLHISKTVKLWFLPQFCSSRHVTAFLISDHYAKSDMMNSISFPDGIFFERCLVHSIALWKKCINGQLNLSICFFVNNKQNTYFDRGQKKNTIKNTNKNK